MKSKKIFKIIAAGILLAAMILLIFIRHYHRSIQGAGSSTLSHV